MTLICLDDDGRQCDRLLLMPNHQRSIAAKRRQIRMRRSLWPLVGYNLRRYRPDFHLASYWQE